MEKMNVQLLLTQEEYQYLEKEANRSGLTVPLYIKGEILKSDPFSYYYKQLIQKVENLPKGTKFNIKALFGVEWTMAKVQEGVITNVKPLGKDSANLMWYEKK